MKLSRNRIPDTTDIRIVDAKTGEDIGRVNDEGHGYLAMVKEAA